MSTAAPAQGMGIPRLALECRQGWIPTMSHSAMATWLWCTVMLPGNGTGERNSHAAATQGKACCCWDAGRCSAMGAGTTCRVWEKLISNF